MREALSLLAIVVCLTACRAASTAAPIAPQDLVFAEKGGMVAVEAEHFTAQSKTDIRAFHISSSKRTPKAGPDGDPSHADTASGGAYVEALPDTRRTHADKMVKGENFTDEPVAVAVLSYRVHFQTTGRYYVWVRAYSTGTEDNGIHVGLDGKWPESGRRMQWSDGKNSWRWDNKQRTAEVHTGVPGQIHLDIDKAGIHEIQFSMREDRFEFDRWLMTTDKDFKQPADAGPTTVAHEGKIPEQFPVSDSKRKNPPQKPNVVLIFADDLGYECITANGGQSYKTPNLDRLAKAGVRFEHCHVQPLCTPSRVQLMTGLYNVRNYLNFGTLVRTETTFAHLTKKAGYATGICGKWQLGREKDSPQHFGFDESYLWQHTCRPPRYANPGLEHNGKELDFTRGEYGPDLVNDFAIDFVTRHKDKPFFLYYPMVLTHDPYQPTPDSPDWAPKAMGEMVNKDVKHFGEMVAYMDKLVGKLDAKLGELGIRDNTLVLFVGDNGTGRGVTSRFGGADVRGGKGTTKATGTHVPFIASWPGVVKKGQVNADLISSVDFLPTICQAVGADVPANTDGVSLLPQLRGEKGTPREWLYTWYSPRQQADLAVNEYAFDHNHKLYRDGQFFDLAADPNEAKPLKIADVTGPAATAAKKLQAALDKFKDTRPAELDRKFRESVKKQK